MSLKGQTRKSALANAMSAFPPIATELRTSLEVRFVSKGNIARLLEMKEAASVAASIFLGGTPLGYSRVKILGAFSF